MSSSFTSAGDKYLWRSVPRAESPERSVTERIGDFLEVYCSIGEEAAKAQASRCLQCPDPACVEGCPVGNSIPAWLGLVSEGRFQAASELLLSSGCMPDMLFRLCRQTCESHCVLDGVGGPVAINTVERFLVHYAQEHALTNVQVRPPNEWRVAVLGSGACGLACSLELAHAGFSVTIFDSLPTPGGYLVQAIPGYKLDNTLVQKTIHALRAMGVEFRMNIAWGIDVSLQTLMRQYDAVFLAPTAERSRPLQIPGAKLAGVHEALQFLIQCNFPWAAGDPSIDLKGRKVVVLGGGDTAMDCARTAIRRGAAQTTCLYRREQSSLPCHPREYQQAVREGVQFQFQALPAAILGSAEGRVSSVCCIHTQPGAMDSTGRPEITRVSGTEFEIPADVVLVAFGFAPPALLQDETFEELKKNALGQLEVNPEQMTNLPGVFAAGALVHPNALLPEVIREAREAAHGIERYLASKKACTGYCAPR